LKNMLVAAGKVDGVAVAPGDAFSLNAALGTPTASDGYEMAQITAGGTGASLYGGGLEQVATTAFRAAAWGGFPIGERHAPPSRVPWLEPPVGLDAAFGPGGDLRFVNDSSDPIFFGVALDTGRSALAWAIYGRPRAREVRIDGPIVTAVEPAIQTPVVQPTAQLRRGVREQAVWKREGAKVAVERVATESGTQVARDTFASDYAPAADVVLVGTGEG
jgi:vancomycin resistance protein YoaR